MKAVNFEGILMPKHLEDLKRSGLLDDIILEHGLRSLSAEGAKGVLNRKTSVGTGYVIPYPTKDGFLEKCVNVRLDVPLKSKGEGKKPRKYVKPIGSKSRLYIPRSVWKDLRNNKIPLGITEGEKKSLKASQEGFPTVAVQGVWNFSREQELIEDFNMINLINRKVYIIYDADKVDNRSVQMAEERFAKKLSEKGALVYLVDLPKGKKLDDFLVFHGANAYEQLLMEAREYDKELIDVIRFYGIDLEVMSAKVWNAIRKYNIPAKIFSFGGYPVWIEKRKIK